MMIFAKYKEWSDGDEYERMVCLVAGTHYAPKHKRPSSHLPSWYRGRLRFNSNKSGVYLGQASLPAGVDRPTCVIERAKLADFFVTKKSGKKKAKTAYVRGTYTIKEVDGKKKKAFKPMVITLPTRGLSSKEYQYILDPSKMYKDFAG